MKTISDIQDKIGVLQELVNKAESNYIYYVYNGDKVLADMEYQDLTFRRGQISMLEWVLDGVLDGVLEDELDGVLDAVENE